MRPIYGVTFLFGIASIGSSIGLLFPALAPQIRGGLAVLLAAAAAVIITLMDVRSTLSY